MDAVVESTEKKKRRTRYRRCPTGKRVTPCDYEPVWFQKLHEHGPLTTKYLHEFTKDIVPSFSTARHRLTDLFHENNTPQGSEYLDHPVDQNRNAKGLFEIHENDHAALEYLKAHGLIPHTPAPRKHTNFPHQFMTACITASIELACRGTGITYIPGSELLKKSPTGTLKLPTSFSYKGRYYDIPIVPDGYFALQYGGAGFCAFLVEADRGTERVHTDDIENQRSYLRKILQYQYLLTRENGAPAPYHKLLGINCGLMVLNVTNLYGRLDNLLSEVMDATGTRGLSFMLFKSLPVFADKLAVPEGILTDLLNTPWCRAGHPDIIISQP